MAKLGGLAKFEPHLGEFPPYSAVYFFRLFSFWFKAAQLRFSFFLLFIMLSNTLYRFIRTGMVHPYAAYMTFKAYKYKDWPKLEFWLLYWMVMAAYMAVELLADILISWYIYMHL